MKKSKTNARVKVPKMGTEPIYSQKEQDALMKRNLDLAKAELAKGESKKKSKK